MHEILHLFGICADSHSHLDIMDILAYTGIEKFVLQINWVKFKIVSWLRL